MAWTTPKTFVAGAVLTAAELNTHMRDNLNHLFDSIDDVGTLFNIASKTAAYTATTADTVLLCDASSGAFTLTLPAASGNAGLYYLIKKIDSSANAITIDANGSETIDGATTYVSEMEDQAVLIVCDGSNWETLSHTANSLLNVVLQDQRLYGLGHRRPGDLVRCFFGSFHPHAASRFEQRRGVPVHQEDRLLRQRGDDRWQCLRDHRWGHHVRGELRGSGRCPRVRRDQLGGR